ncbi:hypothetical protein [Enterococcus gilvus]|uniref:Uncharacterized protein n=1 Tax=Enterococcus gilvus ATCC BAA-350 TaxID=1158614 RepID=R2XKJ9_9ENTE|nr:hypothetical protein [Enterococcus gilvus]EOI55103.1 hypothetical protein UKC_03145 [Enterococcus gilvus ATCC BAA-350]EOW81520.1 hypothetical protein I592_00815 [Enterococcus gilvus ATCC BAA-350]OJG40309.1 hypothetical protein RV02_GL002486 [Enterococcus gilvus]
MPQRHVKQRTDQNLLLILGVFVAALLFDSFRDLFLHGWSAKRAFSIAVVLFFLPFSYLIEKKTDWTNRARLLVYFFYFLITGTFASAILYQNHLTGEMLFLYCFLSFFGSLSWFAICKRLKTKK